MALEILQTLNAHPLFSKEFWKSILIWHLDDNSQGWLDLTPFNTIAATKHSHRLMKKHQATIAIGRYGEKRPTTYTQPLFQTANKENRNIHLGLDFTVPEATPIYAPLAGEVFSVANHQTPGDYGPTLILKHKFDNLIFYTLYGHLSTQILQYNQKQHFEKGEIIATVGSSDINGQWTPHLHFQIILHLDEGMNNYPGTCTEAESSHYLTQCPNPNLLLKIQELS